MITFDGVTKRYGTHLALNGVSFSVPKGQILGLLGQNGAGKTTAMNILTGCLAPSGGSVSIGGYDVMNQPRQAKRLLGYLPEQARVLKKPAFSFVARVKDSLGYLSTKAGFATFSLAKPLYIHAVSK